MSQKVTYIISDINKAVFFEKTALGLREKGIELSFILINCSNTELAAFLESHNFQTAHLSVKSIARSFFKVWECSRILKKFKTTAIHCHMGTANWVGIWAAKLLFIKQVIYTRHDGQPLLYTFKERIIDTLQNILSTRIVAISINIQDLLLRQGVALKKITLVEHGFDLKRMLNPNQEEVLRIKQQYNPSNQSPTVGVIARWHEMKGVQYIIPAFVELLKTYPDAKLCLFNARRDAEYGKEISDLLKNIPAKNYSVVAFESNVFDLFQLFDIYVHVPINPYCEAFGQTYIEALAAGIPSIFTHSGIAKEFIVPEEDALVVEFQNSEAIYKAMIRLLNDAPLREKLIVNGKQKVQQRFGLDIYLKNLVSLYQK